MSEQPESEKPPVFAHWSGWYWTVLIVMLLQLIVYCWITFSYA